jgi:hypothetical protein
MTGDSIVEIPALRQRSRMQSLHREKKKGLFGEKPISLFHSCSDSFHQSPSTRKKNTRTR